MYLVLPFRITLYSRFYGVSPYLSFIRQTFCAEYNKLRRPHSTDSSPCTYIQDILQVNKIAEPKTSLLHKWWALIRIVGIFSRGNSLGGKNDSVINHQIININYIKVFRRSTMAVS